MILSKNDISLYSGSDKVLQHDGDNGLAVYAREYNDDGTYYIRQVAEISKWTANFSTSAGVNVYDSTTGARVFHADRYGGSLPGSWKLESVDLVSPVDFYYNTTRLGQLWSNDAYLIYGMNDKPIAISNSNGKSVFIANGAGGSLSGTWYGTSGMAITSDSNKKHEIESLPDSYSTFFDLLRPVRFKFNDGTSGRYHTGFISQEVGESIEAAELTSADFGGFVRDNDDNYYLRYEEFIALNTNEIQKLKTENKELKQRLAVVEQKLDTLLAQKEV